MSEEIFKNRPVEADTVILATQYAEYEGIPVLIEKWEWDGIYASSCVVPLANLEDAGIKPRHFIKTLKKVLSIEGQTTEKQKDGFLFLNFNFKA